MGQADSCACLERAMNGGEDKEAQERVQMLQRGEKFMRSAFLGISQRELYLTLSDDKGILRWKSNKTTWAAEEKGEIDLTTNVKTVKLVGASGMQIVGMDDKSIFDITAEDPKVRDQWVIALNELLQKWAANPESKPKANLTAAGTSNKAEYFKMREEEIKQREKLAKDMKQKYASGGMKYTALAMANRSS